jgi:hypothetical protein
MVGIVIFLELDRLKFETSERLRRRKLVSNLLKLSTVVEVRRIGIRILRESAM